MPITIGSNIASLGAQRKLAQSSDALAKTFERLSSGQRINQASDDAAGLSVATSLSTDARVFTQAIRNINDGISYLGIAQGALTELANISTRQMELAEQAANGVYNTAQRKGMQDESDQLTLEFTRILESTKFNSQTVFDQANGRLNLQAGYGNNAVLSFNLGQQLGRSVGSGSFVSSLLYTTGSFATEMRTADFNKDGKADIVAGYQNATSATVGLGNGDGTFSFATLTTPALVYPGNVRTVDVNGDNNLDLVMIGSWGSQGEGGVALGNGNGTFKAVVPFDSGGGVDGVQGAAMGDINGDGFLDLVGPNDTNDYARILLGNGDGTFKAVSTFALDPLVNRNAELAELNGDGKLDLVVGSSIYFGNGNGTFKAPTLQEGTSGAYFVADTNRDGNNDLYFQDTAGFYVSKVKLGNGNGTFKISQIFNVGSIGNGNARSSFADLNSDGLLDFVQGTAYDSRLLTFLANSDGTFKSGIVSDKYLTGFENNGEIAIADFTGDGISDIIANSGDHINLLLLTGQSTTSLATPFLNLLTQSDARGALDTTRATLERIGLELGAIGSMQSRMDVTASNLRSARENFIQSASRITDADIAQESSDLVRKQILQQAGAAVLAQTNQQPALALQLLRGG